MVNARHGKQTIDQGIHGAIAFQYANAAARAAGGPFESSDINKLAYQVDTGEIYVLTNPAGPTWSIFTTLDGVVSHATSHESGGADEVTVDNLITLEMNTSYALKPDGAGGVHWGLAGGGGSGSGSVTGPVSTTDNALVRWDGTDGYFIQDSGIIVDNSDNITGAGTINGVTITAHSSRHESGGADEIDGYQIGVVYTPSNYSAPASDILGLHLYEIDQELSTIITDHGGLTGLADDDHTQYLLVSGVRAMSGALDMGTNNITNVGTVDGVTVSSHASRHENGGADEVEVSNLGTSELNTAYVLKPDGAGGVHWVVSTGGGGSGSGSVTGPVTTTDNALVRWDGTDGYFIQDSGIIVDNSDNITGVGTINGVTITAHASRHESGGADAIDGYQLGVVYAPSNYGAPASDILGLHLYEIDQELSTIITDHGLLTGLSDDDHTQYLLVNGTRAMSGSLNMGTSNITNVGTVDGVDVSSHNTRHESGGADEIDGYNLGIVYAPSNYSAPSSDILGLHLYEIDQELDTIITDHGLLTGLVDDDHTQYLLVSGSRAMSGALDMGTNNIINVGTVDGVDISNHTSRHESGGADEIDGYNLGIVYAPSNYGTPSSGILGLYLYEIDQALASSGVTDHGLLTGLADDDHTQYLLASGTRAMSGDLDLGNHDFLNAHDGYFARNLEIGNKLTVGGLIDPTGLVLDTQASAPGGTPAAGKATVWVRSSDGYFILTDDTGTDNIISSGGGAAGPHASTHENGGSDEIDGYNISLIYTPKHYTSPSSDILGLHITNIDNALVSKTFVMFVLTDDVDNTTEWFTVSRGTGGDFASGKRSGSYDGYGLQNQNSCSPFQVPFNGKIIGAILTLKGAGVQSASVFYPVLYMTDLYLIGFGSETKLGDINFSISNSYTVGIYSVGDTDYTGYSSLNIDVVSGQMLGLKFMNGNGSSEVGQTRNAFITLILEEV